MKKLLSLALLFLALAFTSQLSAQDLMKAQDLSTLKVDYLSDADLAKIRTQLETNQVTIEQQNKLLYLKECRRMSLLN